MKTTVAEDANLVLRFMGETLVQQTLAIGQTVLAEFAITEAQSIAIFQSQKEFLEKAEKDPEYKEVAEKFGYLKYLEATGKYVPAGKSYDEQIADKLREVLSAV